HAGDISSIALQLDSTSMMYHCPIVSVDSDTALTCQSPNTLPEEGEFTGRAFLSKHSQKVRALVAGVASLVSEAESAKDDAVLAKNAAEAAQSAAEVAAETAGKSA